MKHQNAVIAAATKVWSVKDYCRRFNVNQVEEKKLVRLFGQYATACELRYNVQREPRRH